MTKRTLMILLLTCPVAAAAGQTIYRSVDQSGAVTYSSAPVPGAADSRLMELPPGPDEEQKAAARARLERTRKLGEDMAAEREAQRQADQENPGTGVPTFTPHGAAIGDAPTREDVTEDARNRAGELKEAAREELARRREGRPALPREPVHIQPVPSIGRPGGGAPAGARGARRGRAGG